MVLFCSRYFVMSFKALSYVLFSRRYKIYGIALKLQENSDNLKNKFFKGKDVMATAAYIRNFLSAKLLFHGVLLVNDCLIPECSCRARSFHLAFSVCWMRWQRAQDNLVTQWHPKGLPELSCNRTIDLSLRLSLPAIICVTWWWCWTRCRAATEITLLFFYCVFIRRQGIGAYFALIVGAVEWRSWRSNTNYM